MADHRDTFLANAPCSGLDAAKVVEMFEVLSDEEQAKVELNLMHISSRTWPEQYLWQHIEKNGLRVDRD
jgi:hypothetical protein